MSSDFKTILVKDSTIADITSDMSFPVEAGSSSTTYQQFPSSSNSNSSLIFQVQVPSENIVIDRHVLIQSGLSFTLTVGDVVRVPVGTKAFQYGYSDSFAAFPLASLMSVANAQINNTSVSINLKDCLPQLLRMTDAEELVRYNSMTPSLPDQAWGSYADGLGSNSNPLASYNNNSYDVDLCPRGAFPAVVNIYRYTTAGGAVPVDNSPIALGQAAAPGEYWKVTVQAVVTEPLLLSPFIFGNPEYNSQGFLGINNMNFNFTIDGTLGRMWSSATGYVSAIAPGLVASGQVLAQNPSLFTTSSQVGAQKPMGMPQLLFRFLSTQPSDVVMTRNVVPYTDFSRYLTNQGGNPTIQALSESTLISSNLQINQIPSLFVIVARKPMVSQNWNDASAFLTIRNLSINLNNSSGLLSSAQPMDLWRMAVKNGSSQSWAEFGGSATVNVNAGGAGGYSPQVATTGSLVLLNPSMDLSLPDYLSSNGSIGNFNFQFSATVYNQFGVAVQAELCVIAVNAGLMSTSQGSSNLYTGILTKEAVLACKREKAHPDMTSLEFKRLVGGKLINRAIHHMVRGRRVGGQISGGAKSAGRMSAMCV